MAHVPSMTVTGYLLSTHPGSTEPVQVLRCGDCGSLVDAGEGSRKHLSWHRSHDNNGPGDASAASGLAQRVGW